MNTFLPVILTVSFLIILCTPSIRAQVGLGVDLTPTFSGNSSSKSIVKKLKNPFVFHFCTVFEREYLEIRSLQKIGYGKTELIKVVLIARRAEIDLKEITDKRNKFIHLKSIAEQYQLDYRQIRADAKKYKVIIEKNMKDEPVTEEEPASQPVSKKEKKHEKKHY